MIFNFISCDNCMTSSINIMRYRENKCQVISVFQERFLISDVTQGELPCRDAPKGNYGDRLPSPPLSSKIPGCVTDRLTTKHEC
jgi:hypothetical protein